MSNKGFSNGDRRTDKFIQRLAKALKSRNHERLGATIDWGYANLGKAAMTQILTDIHFNSPLPIDNEDARFYWDWQHELIEKSGMMPEVQEKAVQSLISMLTEEGLTFGKDFSMAPDGGLLLGQEANEAIMKFIPQEEQEEIQQKFSKPLESSVNLTAIATNVGVKPDYFDRLFDLGKQRLAPYFMADDGYFVMDYMTNFIAGTIAKFPELEATNFKWFAMGQFGSPEAIQGILDKAESYPDPPDSEMGRPLEALWEDMVSATGLSNGKEFDRMENGETFMSVEAIKIASRVWESPTAEDDDGIALREIVAALEARRK